MRMKVRKGVCWGSRRVERFAIFMELGGGCLRWTKRCLVLGFGLVDVKDAGCWKILEESVIVAWCVRE